MVLSFCHGFVIGCCGFVIGCCGFVILSWFCHWLLWFCHFVMVLSLVAVVLPSLLSVTHTYMLLPVCNMHASNRAFCHHLPLIFHVCHSFTMVLSSFAMVAIHLPWLPFFYCSLVLLLPLAEEHPKKAHLPQKHHLSKHVETKWCSDK